MGKYMITRGLTVPSLLPAHQQPPPALVTRISFDAGSMVCLLGLTSPRRNCKEAIDNALVAR